MPVFAVGVLANYHVSPCYQPFKELIQILLKLIKAIKKEISLSNSSYEAFHNLKSKTKKRYIKERQLLANMMYMAAKILNKIPGNQIQQHIR